jgi:predicted RNA-binding Zn-ribbon protein involved in translation (DUF1610 family)
MAEFKKLNCPTCGKELIRLEPFEDGKYNFWCDTCGYDISIEDCHMPKKGEDDG